MRRILGLIAILALVVAFAMPVVTADAMSHGKAKDTTEKTMDKAKDEGDKTMDKMKSANPCNPCAAKKANPCAAKNPCNPCKAKN